MTERKYSLSEIDQMRAFFRWRAPQPTISLISCHYGEMVQTDDYTKAIECRNREAEEQLRTAILGGVDPAECQTPTLVVKNAQFYSNGTDQKFSEHTEHNAGQN